MSKNKKEAEAGGLRKGRKCVVCGRLFVSGFSDVCSLAKCRSTYQKAHQKAYRQKPEVKAHIKAYRQKPEVKAHIRAYKKAYRQKPEVKAHIKAHQKAYYQKPEVKAHIKAYCQKPEVKAHQKAYQKAYRQKPEVKAHIRAYKKDNYVCGSIAGKAFSVFTNGATEEMRKQLPRIKKRVLDDCIKNPGKYL